MDDFKVIGWRETNLSFKDGRSVSGFSLYLVQPKTGVNGYACESLFISYAKCGDYHPQVDDIISIAWNRYGKVSSITKKK